MPAKTAREISQSVSKLKISELEHAKAAALGTLVSLYSRRAYNSAIDKFIA